MERVVAPKVTEDHKPIVEAASVRAVLAASEGTGLEARRDKAILLILIDTGMRVSGLGNASVEDADLRHKTLLVTLKGGDKWLVPLGRKAAAALDRYLRARARHPRAADSPWLWLGLSAWTAAVR
jgi:site-specific recombinase XerD